MRNMEFFQGILQFTLPNLPYQYCFPQFYYDGSALMIAFLTPLAKIKTLLPSPHLHPVRATPWHGITLIGAHEYRDSERRLQGLSCERKVLLTHIMHTGTYTLCSESRPLER